jgi:uncharacterized protein YndB with AHSA1/START domain
MTKAIHGSFTVERVYDASPARVFKAFSDPASKARWFVGPAGWQEIKREMDFRPGGLEIAHGRFPNGPETKFVAHYHDIVQDKRLVYVYDMHVGGVFMSVSLATIELTSQGAKTMLRMTEQGVFIDGQDGNESRREGTKYLLEQIAVHLPD